MPAKRCSVVAAYAITQDAPCTASDVTPDCQTRPLASLLSCLTRRRDTLARLLVLAGLAGTGFIPAAAATLEVVIRNVETGNGTIRVAACDREHFTEAGCRHTGIAPADAGTTTVRIESIPAGVYAVQVYHDRNGNGALDRNWLGWPKEGMGFSRNAPMRGGPPDFAAAAIELSEPTGRIELSMRYF